jgi:hypothetical protein
LASDAEICKPEENVAVEIDMRRYQSESVDPSPNR